MGTFGCLEVTIGWYGKERVDYITYDTKDIFRCYEIKVSKSDFHSKAHNTFIGNYNYYAMPKELYEKVKSEIPLHIGVWCDGHIIKNAKKQELSVDKDILKNSMIRSLCREVDKQIQSGEPYLIKKLNRSINKLKNDNKRIYKTKCDFINAYVEKYGFDDLVKFAEEYKIKNY